MSLAPVVTAMARAEELCDVAVSCGDVESANSAVAIGKEIAASIDARHIHFAGVHAELGRALATKYRLTGDLGTLREAIRAYRRGLSTPSANGWVRLTCLNNLGNALADLYRATSDLSALDPAEDAFQEASGLMEATGPRAATVLTGFADVLLERFLVTGREEHLDRALAAAREAVSRMTPSDTGYPVAAAGLAEILFERYRRHGDEKALSESESILRSAATAPLPTSSRALVITALGGAHLIRFERTGDSEALTIAERMLTEAVFITGPQDLARADRLNSLGNVASALYHLFGRARDDARAAILYREAIMCVATGSPSYPQIAGNLAGTLVTRYEIAGDRAALREAAEILRQATEKTPTDVLSAGNLGGVLLRLSVADLDEPLLLEAEYWLRRALASCSTSDIRRALLLNNLAAVCRQQYLRTADPARSAEAEAAGREAADVAGSGDLNGVWALSNLGNNLHERYNATGDQAALSEAVWAHRRALALIEPTSPQYGKLLLNLGRALHSRYLAEPTPEHCREALDTFQRAALSADPASLRIEAARAWGALAKGSERLRAYRLAVELLPNAAPRSIERIDQELGLAGITGLAAEAAGAALDCGQPMEALLLSESARTVLASRQLRFAVDLAELEQTAPVLAGQLRQLHEELDKATLPLIFDSAEFPLISGERSAARRFTDILHRRSRLETEWSMKVAEARRVFGRFLAPPTLDELLAAAGPGPVVVLSSGPQRSDALVVADRQVAVVPLPRVTPGDLIDQVLGCSNGISAALSAAEDPAAFARANGQVLDVLTWLWEAVARPSLDFLDAWLGPEPAGVRRRVWWVSTGLFTLLPVHAAGLYRSGLGEAKALPDRVIPSYAPSIRALGRARERGPDSVQPRTLIVAVPNGLTAAEDGDGVAALVARPTVLSGAAANRERVLIELARNEYFHFAGHAIGELREPSSSRLELDDALASLTLTDVSRLDLGTAEIAFLGGCDTALSGAEVVDEALNLAAAFQIAGYRHVVASLWAADDNTCRDVAQAFWTGLGEQSPDAAARLLADAVEAIRSDQLSLPVLWAGYLHVGL